jgi:hypothetical protein
MKAVEVLAQNNGEVTKAYYAELQSKGIAGEIAVALFRAQKRSSRAKDYRRGKWRRAAYDVKNWSMGELCRLLAQHASAVGIASWGWKPDPDVPFGDEPSHVLYVDLPDNIGQISFHSPNRLSGPDYPHHWSGDHRSAERIVLFCDRVMLNGNGAA